MKKVRTFLLSVMVMAGLVAMPLLTSEGVYAANKEEVCKGISQIGGASDNQCTDSGKSLEKFIENIINILLFLIGAIAVIMIIIGGIRYVTSNGDQSQLTGAKNTILYSVVGLVVAIMAFAIVNFVVRAI